MAQESTQQRIIENTVALVKEKGFGKATIDEICAASEITKGTFYYYYRSKEEVLEDFFENRLKNNNDVMQQNLNHILVADNSWEQLKLIFHPMCALCLELGPDILFQVMISKRANKSGNVIANQDRNNSVIGVLIKKGQDEGLFKNTSDSTVLSNAIRYMIEGLTLDWCHRGGGFDKEERLIAHIVIMLDLNSDMVHTI